MPSLHDMQPHGNLKYYKMYIMPIASKMYGHDAKTAHQKKRAQSVAHPVRTRGMHHMGDGKD